MTDTTRVDSWDAYIGQTALKERLRVHIDAAVFGCRPLEHVLLAAGPGFGKTSMATIIAKEMGGRLVAMKMPVTEKAIATAVQECDSYGEYCIMFLDELHGAGKKEQEFMLPLLEFGHIQDRRNRVYECTNLTIIGATTEPDKLVRPLFDRFPIVPPFDEYSPDEMRQIVVGLVERVGLQGVDDEMCAALGRAAGGTPRLARNLVLAARDLATTLERTPTTQEVLGLCRIDEDGLTHDHYRYLNALHTLGDVSGLANIRNVLRLPESVVRDLELALLSHELIALTASGRELLPTGARKINIRRKERASA